MQRFVLGSGYNLVVLQLSIEDIISSYIRRTKSTKNCSAHLFSNIDNRIITILFVFCFNCIFTP